MERKGRKVSRMVITLTYYVTLHIFFAECELGKQSEEAIKARGDLKWWVGTRARELTSERESGFDDARKRFVQQSEHFMNEYIQLEQMCSGHRSMCSNSLEYPVEARFMSCSQQRRLEIIQNERERESKIARVIMSATKRLISPVHAVILRSLCIVVVVESFFCAWALISAIHVAVPPSIAARTSERATRECDKGTRVGPEKL